MTTTRRMQMIGTRMTMPSSSSSSSSSVSPLLFLGIGRGGGSGAINNDDEDYGTTTPPPKSPTTIFGRLKKWWKGKPKDKPEVPNEFIKHHPTAEQTNGIDPFFVRVCAQVAADVYHKEPRDISQFDDLALIPIEGTVLKEPPKAVIYDSNAPFTVTNPPFVAVVAGDKLILGWRGSQSVIDKIVRDTSVYMGSSSCWKNVAKVVKVHAGSLAEVENSLVVHEAELLKIIDDNKIKEILLTGHSLGGGIAQVAQLWFQGTMDEEIDPTPNKWKKLAKEGLTVKCMSFEGMSTTVYAESDDKELNQKGIDFINKCGANMCTTAFSVDPVPMCNGHFPDFVMDFIENVVDTLPNKAGHFIEYQGEVWALGIVKRLIDNKLHDFENTYFPILRKYQHIGKVLHYASPNAEPKVYIDNKNGILVDKEGNKPSLPEMSEIKYERNKKDPIAAMMWNHGYITCGPGLAFYRVKNIPFDPYPSK